MIKNIFLDLDDTILDFKKGERDAISKTLMNFGIAPTEDIISLYTRVNRSLWAALEKKEITRDEVLTRRFDIVFQELGKSADAFEVQHFYERRLAEGCDFIPGAEKLLEYLYPEYNLYITTNGTAFVQDRRIAKSGIAKYFKDIFVSERLGANKPSEEFFDACFEKMENKNRTETLIIGDNLHSDILGGINAGIHTCLFIRDDEFLPSEIKPDFVIHSLDEVREVLEKLR